MKTTLDLPADVARALRLESARRGGRTAASLTRLVSDAVRRAYVSPEATTKSRIDLTPGRVVVTPPRGTPKVTSETVRAALYD